MDDSGGMEAFVRHTALWNPHAEEEVATCRHRPAPVKHTEIDIEGDGDEDCSEGPSSTTIEIEEGTLQQFTVVDMEEADEEAVSEGRDDQQGNVQYRSSLEWYLEKMYFVGMCPRNPRKPSQDQAYFAIQTVREHVIYSSVRQFTRFSSMPVCST